MFGKILTILLVVAVIGGFAYAAWKYFMPEASKDYLELNEIQKFPEFVPKGGEVNNLPKAPGGRASE